MKELIDSDEFSIDNDVWVLYNEAKRYLLKQDWCDSIVRCFWAQNWEDMLCVFYFEINSLGIDVDDKVCVIVGDIPPAYIDLNNAKSVSDALESYIYIMSNWVDNVNSGKEGVDAFPIAVEPTEKYADMLMLRLNFISQNMLTEASKDEVVW